MYAISQWENLQGIAKYVMYVLKDMIITAYLLANA